MHTYIYFLIPIYFLSSTLTHTHTHFIFHPVSSFQISTQAAKDTQNVLISQRVHVRVLFPVTARVHRSALRANVDRRRNGKDTANKTLHRKERRGEGADDAE